MFVFHDDDDDIKLNNFKITLMIIVLFSIESISKYNIEKNYRIIFLNEKEIKLENKKINKLLSNLVPDFVKETMIAGNFKFSEDQGAVAILFCDISNFDKIVSGEKKNIVKFMDNLYRIFDTFCIEGHVQKIEVKNNFLNIFLYISLDCRFSLCSLLRFESYRC